MRVVRRGACYVRFFEPDVFVETENGLFGLDVIGVHRERYRKEFQFVHRRDSFVATFEDDNKHGPYLDAAFGGFPNAPAFSYIRRGYGDAFSPTTLRADASAWLRIVSER